MKMLELLAETWVLISGLLSSIFGALALVIDWLVSIGVILHVEYPRLEGLLVGILFAYFFHHRDRNPWLRTLASPLKIIIDIIDIIWDETLEALVDLWGDVRVRLMVPINWSKDKVKWGWAKVMSSLQSLRNVVKKKADADSEEDGSEQG